MSAKGYDDPSFPVATSWTGSDVWLALQGGVTKQFSPALLERMPTLTVAGASLLAGGVAVLGAVGSSPFAVVSAATGDDPVWLFTQYRGTTTDATATTLPGATIAIPASTTVGLRVIVLGRRTGGSAGSAEDGCYFERTSAFKNVAGTATQIGTSLNVNFGPGGTVTVPAPSISGNNVNIQVTGAANNNYSWHAHVHYFAVGS